jgi:hypothetical protein
MGPVGLWLRVWNKNWRKILIIREKINKRESEKMAEVFQIKENASGNQKKKRKGEEKKMCSLDIPLFITKRRVNSIYCIKLHISSSHMDVFPNLNCQSLFPQTKIFIIINLITTTT